MKKGFTLIELLGVLVILSIVLVITIPMLLNNIEESREDSFKVNARILAQTIMNHKNANPHFDVSSLNLENIKAEINVEPDSYESITAEYLYKKVYVEIIGKNKWSKYKACGFHNKIQIVEKTDDTTCENIKTSNIPISKANEPVLLAGMTPIRYNGTEWIATTTNDEDWYDYSLKKYANAKTEDGSMWVWIPRYAYKIESGYNSSTSGTFSIKFLEGITNYTADETTIELEPTYSENSQTNYIVHPAFTHNNKQIPGFWMAKFKASAPTTSSCYTNPNVSNCNKTNLFPSFIPNAKIYTHIGIKESFLTAKNMARNNNIYGISNSSVYTKLVDNYNWGAVAYLSKSEYGINTSDVWINPTANFTTGCAGASLNSAQTATCINSYTTTNGLKGSTTYNISGVYDMRGPVWENVGGNYNDNLGSSSFRNTNELNSVNTIKYSGSNYGYNNSKFGDAIFETSSGYVYNGSSWIGTSTGAWGTSYSSFPDNSSAFFKRGGNYLDGSFSGIFSFSSYLGVPEYSAGGNLTSHSFRAVIIPLTTVSDYKPPVKNECPTTILDPRDGKTYKTVKIGEQCWFAEDLKYTTTTCLNATWDATAPHNACRLNGGTGWDKDEVLYQWGAAMNGSTTEGAQGLCPAGWYIPTDNDIKILEMYLGMTQAQVDLTNYRGTNQGDQLKGISPSWCNNATGCASSGFNKRPAGYRNTDGSLFNVGSYGHWWSSSPSGSNAWRRLLVSGHSVVDRLSNSQALGSSVRCLLGQ